MILGPFLRTCRRSRWFDCKVHKWWNSLPHFVLLHSTRQPYVVAQKSRATGSFHSCIVNFSFQLTAFSICQKKSRRCGRSIPATTRGVEWGVIQGRQVEGLKWYTYHCTPSLAMIVDVFVLPELRFQSHSIVDLWTTLVHQCRIKPTNRGLCVWNTERKQTRMKRPFGVSTLSEGCKTCSILWFRTPFYQTVLQEHCKAKTILFS